MWVALKRRPRGVARPEQEFTTGHNSDEPSAEQRAVGETDATTDAVHTAPAVIRQQPA